MTELHTDFDMVALSVIDENVIITTVPADLPGKTLAVKLPLRDARERMLALVRLADEIVKQAEDGAS
jgi:hypothetical protein